MIVLGTAEPSLTELREIRREDIKTFQLVEGLTDEQPNVVISVPSASMMLRIDTAKDRVGVTSIYYECVPGMPDVKVELLAVADQQVEPGWRYLGSFWLSGSLVPVYGRAVTQ